KNRLMITWLKNTLIVYLSLFFLIGATILLAENNHISDEGLFPGLIILFAISSLYFLLKGPSRLRWYHMIFFCINSFIFILVTSLILESRSDIAEEITTNILGSSMLFVALVWIPFLMVSFV